MIGGLGTIVVGCFTCPQPSRVGTQSAYWNVYYLSQKRYNRMMCSSITQLKFDPRGSPKQPQSMPWATSELAMQWGERYAGGVGYGNYLAGLPKNSGCGEYQTFGRQTRKAAGCRDAEWIHYYSNRIHPKTARGSRDTFFQQTTSHGG